MFRFRIKFLKQSSVMFVNAKFKHKDTHWSVVAKKRNSTDKALEHFDDFYKKVFEDSWPAIRHALLGPKKQVAVLNYYGDTEDTIKNLENNGAINMRTLFNLEKQYIKERYETNTKKRKLDKIYKLDKEMDRKFDNIDHKIEETESKMKPELNKMVNGIDKKIGEYTEKLNAEMESKMKPELYDKVKGVVEQNVEKISKQDDTKTKIKNYSSSVADSLKRADIDYSRIITPDSTDVSSALYEFVPATKLKGKEDWIPETQHYKYYATSNEFSVKIEKEYDLNFPEHLNVYAYESNNHTDFPAPRRGTTGVYNYYLLDGASLLPILALGLKPGDKLLDICCAPGGKAYIALQTLYPNTVVCNDVEYSRVNRIQKVLTEYFYDLEKKFLSTGKIRISHENGLEMSYDHYNKILVDVPCTNDRHSLHENDNNWFKGSRIKERLQLPEMQAALLTNALKMVPVGGTVVYSTCSLSPIQNDGVVNMALRKIWEETSIELTVKDLSPALKVAQCCYRFADPKILKFGHLILPYLPQNYGPMYFCKIERNK